MFCYVSKHTKWIVPRVVNRTEVATSFFKLFQKIKFDSSFHFFKVEMSHPTIIVCVSRTLNWSQVLETFDIEVCMAHIAEQIKQKRFNQSPATAAPNAIAFNQKHLYNLFPREVLDNNALKTNIIETYPFMFAYFLNDDISEEMCMAVLKKSLTQLPKIPCNFIAEGFIKKVLKNYEVSETRTREDMLDKVALGARSEEVCELAVNISGLSLKSVPKEFITAELCRAAYRQNENSEEFVPSDVACTQDWTIFKREWVYIKKKFIKMSNRVRGYKSKSVQIEANRLNSQKQIDRLKETINQKNSKISELENEYADTLRKMEELLGQQEIQILEQGRRIERFENEAITFRKERVDSAERFKTVTDDYKKAIGIYKDAVDEHEKTAQNAQRKNELYEEKMNFVKAHLEEDIDEPKPVDESQRKRKWVVNSDDEEEVGDTDSEDETSLYGYFKKRARKN